ncbi:hypothetical protein [Streptomyces sp. NPDC057877]|uniref:effector-associated constant component EACC1 n=1 Tax=Streptomyces sp. NPDC057877 TaxID=3346269 RepID=UPI0036A64796
MRIEIQVGRGGGPATADLYRWLRRDPRVRRHAEVSLGRSRAGGADRGASTTMAAYDVVELVVGQGIAALNLALSYAAWRAARPSAPSGSRDPSAPSVTFTANGRSITVRGRCDEATTRLITELLQDDGTEARDERGPA